MGRKRKNEVWGEEGAETGKEYKEGERIRRGRRRKWRKQKKEAETIRKRNGGMSGASAGCGGLYFLPEARFPAPHSSLDPNRR